MPEIPDFEAEIIIDEKGIITVRNCSGEMIELMYQLNPKDPSILKRWLLLQKTLSSVEVNSCR